MGEDHNSGKPKRNDTLRSLAQISNIGITMSVTVLLGVFLGKFLDSLLNTSPWLLLVFSLLGAGAAIKSLYDSSKGKK